MNKLSDSMILMLFKNNSALADPKLSCTKENKPTYFSEAIKAKRATSKEKVEDVIRKQESIFNR